VKGELSASIISVNDSIRTNSQGGVNGGLAEGGQ